jgi:hypothetical protein
VRCWCDFALARADSDLGRFKRAAAGYISLSKRTPFGDRKGTVEPFAIRAAVHCLQLAEQFSEAELLIRDLIKGAPDDAALWRQLTLCLMKLERMSEAAEAFVEDVGRQRGDSEDTWLSPLVMHLGIQVMSHQSIVAAIENAALFAPARQLGERLVTWYSPWTASMSTEAKKKWWVGLYTIGSDEAIRNIGDSVWEEAIVYFAEAIALELKAKVFRPAGQTSSDAIGQASDTWRKAFAGRAALGACYKRENLRVPSQGFCAGILMNGFQG